MQFRSISVASRIAGMVLLVAAAASVVPAHAADGSAVRGWEGTITLPTYAWHDDVNPVFAELDGRIYYPYTRQDHIAQTNEDRTYKALFLENEYLKVTCLPELGGRIHSVLDKTTGEEMFHKNNEIKPALIAMRGAWIGGGIEWNVGPQGHTVTILSPVDALVLHHDDGSATLVIGNTEKMFRTRWTVRLTLHPGRAYLDETIRIFNPTDGVHPYYFWNCTAFPNLAGTRFIYPMTLGTDHNGTSFFTWPVHEGKDLSWLKNYDTMTSIFAYACEFDFFGAYDVDRDRGIVSYANHHELKGKKAWTWGKDDFGVVSQMALSDAGPVHAQYIEVQSGPLLTQSDYGMLKPRQEVRWREFWYPVHGLGDGFEYATRDVAVQTRRENGKLDVRVIATGVFPNARCILTQGGETIADQPVDLSPLEAQRVTIDASPDGPVTITIRAADGVELARFETPLPIPKVDPPIRPSADGRLDAAEKRARPDGEPTAGGLFRAAYLADSQSNPSAARTGYQEVLAMDPWHVASLCGLAELDIELGRFDAAAAHAKNALKRDPDHGTAWHLLGVAYFNRGSFDEAMRCGYKAAHALDTLALGYNLVGRAAMRVGMYDKAVAAFARARAQSPEDTRNRDHWLAARYAAGDVDGVAQDAAVLVEKEDPTAFVPRALLALQRGDADFMKDVAAVAGEIEFTVTEAAIFFAELGLCKEAVRLLEALSAEELSGPLPGYYLAYYRHVLGDDDGARAALRKATEKPGDYTFPARVEVEDALRYALESGEADLQAPLLLGHLCAGLRRMDEAVSYWEQAVERDPGQSVAWRLLGYRAWKKSGDLDKAEQCYRNAVAARPQDQILYRDLAQILAALDRRAEAIEVIETAPFEGPPRDDIAVWLAEAYLAEQRYDDCIAFLRATRFSNWEGSSKPRDIYVDALMARGKGRYEAGQYEQALGDFQEALTYPANLQVGQRYQRTDAETRYWQGKTHLALGQTEDARTAWEEGAQQATATQDEYVKRCATALEILRIGNQAAGTS